MVISGWVIKKKEIWVIYLVLILNFTLKFVLFKIKPEIAYMGDRNIHVLMLLLFIYLIVRSNINLIKNKYTLLVFTYILIFWIYLYVNSTSKNLHPLAYIHFFRNHFFYFPLVLFAVLLSTKQSKPQDSDPIKFLVYLMLFESALGVSQYLSDEISAFFKIPYYVRHGQEIRRFGEMIMESRKAIFGTLTTPAGYNTVMSLLAVFLGGIWVLNIYRPQKKYGQAIYLLCISLTVVTVLLGGFRLGLGTLLIGGLLILWFKRKWLAAVIGSFSFLGINILVTSYHDLIYSAAQRKFTIEQPFMRLMGLFAVFDPKIGSDNYLSLTRTIRLFDDIKGSLFFGKPMATYLVGDYDSYTDAFLALLMLDLGFVGLFLVVLPYLYVLKLINEFCPKPAFQLMLIIFIVGLTQSLADESFLFSRVGHFFYAISAICIYQFRRKKVIQAREQKTMSGKLDSAEPGFTVKSAVYF